MVNSRHRLVTATSSSSDREDLHHQRHTFSRSYGANLQSSLTTVLSSALVFSTHPPVLVWGTDFSFTPLAAFLGSMGSLATFQPKYPRHITSRPLLWEHLWFRMLPAYMLEPESNNRHQLPFFVPASFNDQKRYRNINLFAIAYAFRPRLRIRLTRGGLTWPRKPWVYGEEVSHFFYRYSLRHLLL